MKLCVRGCGFYGTPENLDLCSSCYTLYLKQKIAQSEQSIIAKAEPPLIEEADITRLVDAVKSIILSDDHSHNINNNNRNYNNNNTSVTKNRCGSCKKKLGLLGFACKCGGSYCGKHRYPEEHLCNIDFKKAGKISLMKDNPVCKADKISERI